VGTWTFMILWWMHQSATLNVFLGVRNLNEEFLPEHLHFLKSFLTKKPMNLLFPVSVTVSTIIAVTLVEKAVAPGAGAFRAVGFTLLATMMTLAVLEHWFLVLPLPAAALWRWGLASRAPSRAFDAEIVVGFLGRERPPCCGASWRRPTRRCAPWCWSTTSPLSAWTDRC
jgi:Protein of unknown function (DUF3623)